MAMLSRLSDKLPATEGPHVVDAETAGRLLGVTSRTARRLLHALAEEGLAWPLPPNRIPQPGRPRQLYRLVTEKLGHGDYGRRGEALATARNASSASGVPTEMRAPSSPNGRMLIPASPHTAAKSWVSGPSRSQTKFASVGGTDQPRANSSSRTRARSFTA